MATKNDITGDVIQTKGVSAEYRDNYDRIFGKKGGAKRDKIKISRIDIIGQNGGTGLHYIDADIGDTKNESD